MKAIFGCLLPLVLLLGCSAEQTATAPEQGADKSEKGKSAQVKDDGSTVKPESLSALAIQGNLGVNMAVAVRPKSEITANKADSVAGLLFDASQSMYQDENLIYSPLSLQRLLHMVYLGSAGTSKQLLVQVFADKLQQPVSSDQLKLAEAAFVEQGYPILPRFTERLKTNLATEIFSVDFHSAPVKAGEAINTWVSDNTQQMITELVDPSRLSTDTKLFLAATAYFNAKWQTPFKSSFNYKAEFNKAEFNNADATRKVTSFMKNSLALAYIKTHDYELVKLDYRDNNSELWLFMATEPEQLKQTMAALLAGEQPEFSQKQVLLHLPKLNLAVDFALTETLYSLGLRDLFEQTANFSAITGDKRLAIDQAMHKVSLVFDEQGTQAASASGVGFAPKMFTPLEPHQVEVKFNRPFALLIRDKQQQTPLFTGIINRLDSD